MSIRVLARTRYPLQSKHFSTSPLSNSIPVSTFPTGTGGMAPPLKGIRIVDLTRVLAGPYATMALADLGAEVIKIENPLNGDDTRAWSPPSAPTLHQAPQTVEGERNGLRKEDWSGLPPESAYFLSVNRNKKSVGVNLKSVEGLKIVHELIAKADILVRSLSSSFSTLSTCY